MGKRGSYTVTQSRHKPQLKLENRNARAELALKKSKHLKQTSQFLESDILTTPNMVEAVLWYGHV